MESPDVNILIHAFRKDCDLHQRCRDWLEKRINGASRFALSPLVVSGFLRIVTHPRIFVQPSRLDEAIAFSERIHASPNMTILDCGDRHWEIFTRLSRETRAVGNAISDAWLAAMAIERACVWVTLDQGFKRFRGLKTLVP